jgi:hypothetical protein
VSTANRLGGKTYKHIEVDLSTRDGNAFAIIGRVAGALRRGVSHEVAEAFRLDAMDSESYDDLIQLAMRTVTVHWSHATSQRTGGANQYGAAGLLMPTWLKSREKPLSTNVSIRHATTEAVAR